MGKTVKIGGGCGYYYVCTTSIRERTLIGFGSIISRRLQRCALSSPVKSSQVESKLMGRAQALTAEQRLAIVRQSDRHPAWKQKELGEWAADTFHLSVVPSQPTISIVLRAAGRPAKPRASTGARAPRKLVTKPKPQPKKPKVVRCPEVERALVRWLDAQIAKDLAVSVTAVQTQARGLVDTLKVEVDGFVVSDAWVDTLCDTIFSTVHLDCPTRSRRRTERTTRCTHASLLRRR